MCHQCTQCTLAVYVQYTLATLSLGLGPHLYKLQSCIKKQRQIYVANGTMDINPFLLSFYFFNNRETLIGNFVKEKGKSINFWLHDIRAIVTQMDPFEILIGRNVKFCQFPSHIYCCVPPTIGLRDTVSGILTRSPMVGGTRHFFCRLESTPCIFFWSCIRLFQHIFIGTTPPQVFIFQVPPSTTFSFIPFTHICIFRLDSEPQSASQME